MVKGVPALHPIPNDTVPGDRTKFRKLRGAVTGWLDGFSPFWRAQLWLLPLLMLAINGGAQLLLSAAFAETGVIAATVFMIITALANCWTSNKLCWQAYYVGQVNYESLSFAIGGRAFKLLTEVSIFILLFGTLVNGWQQQGATFLSGSEFINPNLPNDAHWLVGGQGRMLMFFSFIVVLPAIFMNSMSSLEVLADASFVMVIVSVIWVIVVCADRGFPALGKACIDPPDCTYDESTDYYEDPVTGAICRCYGEFPISGFISQGGISQAISTFGFIFYIQPIMMPLLHEMPAGRVGPRALSVATCVTIAGTSFVVYWACGFFGASAFGAAAIGPGNYLVNDLGGGKAQGALNILYIAAMIPSIPPFEYSTRHAVDSFICNFLTPAQIRKTYRWRNILLAATLYAASLGLSLGFPGNTQIVVNVTSAIGVLLVSYVIPVVIHFSLLFGYAGVQRDPNWMQNAPPDPDVVMATSPDEAKHHPALARASTQAQQAAALDAEPGMGHHNTEALDPKLAADGSSESSGADGTANGKGYEGDMDKSYASGASATSQTPLNVRGAIAGGALDYEYRPKSFKHPWVILNDFIAPIFITAFGFWASIETLKTI